MTPGTLPPLKEQTHTPGSRACYMDYEIRMSAWVYANDSVGISTHAGPASTLPCVTWCGKCGRHCSMKPAACCEEPHYCSRCYRWGHMTEHCEQFHYCYQWYLKLLEAARSRPESRSGIVTEEDGRRTVPSSTRGNGTTRPDPAYLAQEYKEMWRKPSAVLSMVHKTLDASGMADGVSMAGNGQTADLVRRPRGRSTTRQVRSGNGIKKVSLGAAGFNYDVDECFNYGGDEIDYIVNGDSYLEFAPTQPPNPFLSANPQNTNEYEPPQPPSNASRKHYRDASGDEAGHVRDTEDRKHQRRMGYVRYDPRAT